MAVCRKTKINLGLDNERHTSGKRRLHESSGFWFFFYFFFLFLTTKPKKLYSFLVCIINNY